jgi:hypothetical protein
LSHLKLRRTVVSEITLLSFLYLFLALCISVIL